MESSFQVLFNLGALETELASTLGTIQQGIFDAINSVLNGSSDTRAGAGWLFIAPSYQREYHCYSCNLLGSVYTVSSLGSVGSRAVIWNQMVVLVDQLHALFAKVGNLASLFELPQFFFSCVSWRRHSHDQVMPARILLLSEPFKVFVRYLPSGPFDLRMCAYCVSE